MMRRAHTQLARVGVLVGVAVGVSMATALAAAPVARADSLDEIFARANEAFFRGDFEAAAAGYRRLGELGVVDADVSYDLATAEARAGRYGHAIQHFERALWIRPGDDDAREGLETARSAAGRRRADRQGVAEVDTAPPLSEALFGGISRNTFGAAVLLSSWLFFAALIGLLFVRRESARLGLGIAAPLALVVLLVSGSGLAVTAGWLEDGEPAVVLEEHAPLREGPDPRATERHRAEEGQRAWIVAEDRDWYRVRIPGVGEGWAAADAIGRVRP